MIPVSRIILTFLLILFSSTVFANYGSKLCKSDPAYTCHKVKKGETWEKLFPDDAQRDVVMKINRMNIRLSGGVTIAVPVNATVAMMDAAPFDKQIDSPGEKMIYVSIDKLAWGAYDDKGSLVNWGPISSAKGYCPDIHRGCHTSLGKFAVYRKQGSGCVSTKFPVGRGGAPMPYCMFFNGGFALHGSYNVPGYNDSHGCVRLFVKDAKWLNEEFVGDENVPVVVRQF